MASPTSNTPRTSRGVGRKLLWGFFGLIGLLVVLVAILPYVVSLDTFKEQIVTQAETALGRKVTVGQVRLQIFTGLGVGLADLTIANPPDWQQPNFVQLKTLSVKAALLPLLQRRIEIRKVILADGAIFIERDAEGRFNYDDLTAAKPAEESPTPQEGPSPLAGLLVANVALRDVDVTFIDRMTIPGETLTTTAHDLQVDINNIALDTPIDFDIATALLEEGKPNVRLTGRIDGVPATLVFDQVPIAVTLQIDALRLGKLTPYMGPEPALLDGQLSTNVTVQGTLAQGWKLTGSESLAQAVLPADTEGGKPITLPDITLTQQVTLDMQKELVQLQELQVDVASLQARLTGVVSQFLTAPHVDVELTTNEFAPGEVVRQLPMLAAALPSPTEIEGRMQLRASSKGTLEQLRSTSQIDIQELKIRLGSNEPIIVPQARLTHAATVQMSQEMLTLEKAQLDLAPLQVNLQGTLQNFTAPTFDIQLSTNEFAPGELLQKLPMLAAALPSPAEVRGRVRLQATAKGTQEKLHSTSQIDVQGLNVRLGDSPPISIAQGRLTQATMVDLPQQVAQLKDIQLDIGSMQVSLQGTVQQFSTAPRLDLQLTTNNFAPGDVLKQVPMLAAALPNPTEIRGHVQLQASAKGTLEKLHSTAQVDVQGLDMRLGQGDPIRLRQARLTQDTVVDMKNSRVDLTNVQLDLASLQVQLKGTVRQFATTPKLDVTLTTNDFAPGEVIQQVPMLQAALPSPLDMQGRMRLRASAKGALSDLRSEAHVVIDKLSLKSGTFSGAKRGGGLWLDTTKTEANLTAHVVNSQPADVVLDLKAQRLVFDQQSDETAPPAPDTPSPSGSESMAPPFNLRGQVTIGQGRIKNLRFQQMTADVEIIKGLLKSQQSFSMYDGSFQGQLQANLAQPRPDYTLDAKLTGVNIDGVVNDLSSLKNVLYGKMTTDLKFSGQGFAWADISKTLTGTGSVQMLNTKFTTIDLMPRLALGLDAASKLAGFRIPPDLAERSFDTLKAAFQINQGKISTQDLKLAGRDVEVLAKGLLGLDQSLDFAGTTFLLGKLVQSFGNRASFLHDGEGRIQLPFALRGSVTSPRIAIDEKHLLDMAKKVAVKQIEQKAGKEIKKLLDQAPAPVKNIGQGVQQLLDKTPLARKKPTPQKRRTAPQPQQKAPEQPIEKEIGKALKGLFKR